MQEVKINKGDSAFTVADELMLILSPAEVYSARVTAGITGQGKTPVQAVKDWQAAGCPMHERPELATVDTSDQVAATVTYRVIGKRGTLNKGTQEVDVTRGAVWAVRDGKRTGRISTDQYAAAALTLIDEGVRAVPSVIVTSTGDQWTRTVSVNDEGNPVVGEWARESLADVRAAYEQESAERNAQLEAMRQRLIELGMDPDTLA